MSTNRWNYYVTVPDPDTGELHEFNTVREAKQFIALAQAAESGLVDVAKRGGGKSSISFIRDRLPMKTTGDTNARTVSPTDLEGALRDKEEAADMSDEGSRNV